MTVHYIALIHKDKDTDYGVMFPDFPGCITAGKTVDDAIAMATEALAGHVDVMREFGDPVPTPRDLESIREAREDWIEWQDATVALIPLLPLSGRSVRINVTMDERLLARIDAVTRNRSAFLSQAAQTLLDRNGAA